MHKLKPSAGILMLERLKNMFLFCVELIILNIILTLLILAFAFIGNLLFHYTDFLLG